MVIRILIEHLSVTLYHPKATFALAGDASADEITVTVVLGRFGNSDHLTTLQAMDPGLPSPLETPPVILFRVECHNPGSSAYNRTFSTSGMSARDTGRSITAGAFVDCLSWAHINTPFIPFTKDWRRALRRTQWLIEQGERNVVIIAIWSKGLRNVYDGYDAAKKYEWPTKRMENHLDECLVYGGISADEYRVLVIFNGAREWVDVPLGVPGLRSSTTIPDSFMRDVPGDSAEEKLENEIYRNTGIRGQSEQLLYLSGVMIGAFCCPWTSFVVVPEP